MMVWSLCERDGKMVSKRVKRARKLNYNIMRLRGAAAAIKTISYDEHTSPLIANDLYLMLVELNRIIEMWHDEHFLKMELRFKGDINDKNG